MQKDNYITEVMFRKVKSKDFKGTIDAYFPYEINDLKGNITCYSTLGGHSGVTWDYVLTQTVPAKEIEYKALKSELEYNYGYNLKVVKKRNYRRYIKEFENVLNQCK